jgi:6-aminohexanoate-oligomer endohydrolase
MNFTFPGIKIGIAENPAGPTGCTVITLPQFSLLTADIRGGSPGTVMGMDGEVDAVCFAGGSLYGLEAAAGVTAGIASERGWPIVPELIPIVRGAIIYDYHGRVTTTAPDKALGLAAHHAAVAGSFPTGRVGAGRSATVGKMGKSLGHEEIRSEPGGQGAAFGEFVVGEQEFRIFVCTVVNALGGIVDRSGTVVRGHVDAAGKRWRAAEIYAAGNPAPAPAQPKGNTTVSLVVTNCGCPDFFARQAARQIHTSMARAIDPFHTQDDGDVLYFVRTADAIWPTPKHWPAATTQIGILGSELMWDAILAACE